MLANPVGWGFAGRSGETRQSSDLMGSSWESYLSGSRDMDFRPGGPLHAQVFKFFEQYTLFILNILAAPKPSCELQTMT